MYAALTEWILHCDLYQRVVVHDIVYDDERCCCSYFVEKLLLNQKILRSYEHLASPKVPQVKPQHHCDCLPLTAQLNCYSRNWLGRWTANIQFKWFIRIMLETRMQTSIMKESYIHQIFISNSIWSFLTPSNTN